MNPQIMGLIRDAMKIVGGLMVGYGIGDEALWAEIGGGVVALVGVIWAQYAKTPSSPEAQQIAQRVVDDPDVPSPLPTDRKRPL